VRKAEILHSAKCDTPSLLISVVYKNSHAFVFSLQNWLLCVDVGLLTALYLEAERIAHFKHLEKLMFV
jgi:hypothetical protein